MASPQHEPIVGYMYITEYNSDDVEVEDELDLYSYKWEHLTKAEQNNALHESYQFLIKKFISLTQLT